MGIYITLLPPYKTLQKRTHFVCTSAVTWKRTETVHYVLEKLFHKISTWKCLECVNKIFLNGRNFTQTYDSSISSSRRPSLLNRTALLQPDQDPAVKIIILLEFLLSTFLFTLIVMYSWILMSKYYEKCYHFIISYKTNYAATKQ